MSGKSWDQAVPFTEIHWNTDCDRDEWDRHHFLQCVIKVQMTWRIVGSHESWGTPSLPASPTEKKVICKGIFPRGVGHLLDHLLDLVFYVRKITGRLDGLRI